MDKIYEEFNRSYGAFVIANILDEKGLIDHSELDVAWESCLVLYEAFKESPFNVNTKSEMECIEEYIKSRQWPIMAFDRLINKEA